MKPVQLSTILFFANFLICANGLGHQIAVSPLCPNSNVFTNALDEGSLKVLKG